MQALVNRCQRKAYKKYLTSNFYPFLYPIRCSGLIDTWQVFQFLEIHSRAVYLGLLVALRELVIT